MSLINALEGLTTTKGPRQQWSDVEDAELGVYDSLTSYEIWTPLGNARPLTSVATENEAAQKLLSPLSDDKAVGGIKVLVFHGWKSKRDDSNTNQATQATQAIQANQARPATTTSPGTPTVPAATATPAPPATQATAIRSVLTALDLPLWLLARLFTHSFFSGPTNGKIESLTSTRKYWQRFRGGFLLWSYELSTNTTRALFFCRSAEYWASFEHCLDRCVQSASQPMVCGVLAYIQQVKVSVSYVYSVRDKVDKLLKDVDKSLDIITSYEKNSASQSWNINLLAQTEDEIELLVHCASEATRAVPYLNDNRGNLYRIVDNLTAIKAENTAYRDFWASSLKKATTTTTPPPITPTAPTSSTPTPTSPTPPTTMPATATTQATSHTHLLITQADNLSGLIDALLTEIKSQIQAADWVFTKIDSLVSNTNLSINRTDQRRNMEIADSSYTISVESKKDNLSMVTIAAITMLFLPGTFVASFFAMPVLDWEPEPGQPIVNKRFYIYWVITAPLTIGVVVLWLACFRFRRPSKDTKRTYVTIGTSGSGGTSATGAATAVGGGNTTTTSTSASSAATGNNINKPVKTPSFTAPLRTTTEKLRFRNRQRTDWSAA